MEDLLRRGNAGRRLVPRKRGEHDRDFVVVPVAVPDEPGQLAGVLVSAAQAGINVEDVRVEHLPANGRSAACAGVERGRSSRARPGGRRRCPMPMLDQESPP